MEIVLLAGTAWGGAMATSSVRLTNAVSHVPYTVDALVLGLGLFACFHLFDIHDLANTFACFVCLAWPVGAACAAAVLRRLAPRRAQDAAGVFAAYCCAVFLQVPLVAIGVAAQAGVAARGAFAASSAQSVSGVQLAAHLSSLVGIASMLWCLGIVVCAFHATDGLGTLVPAWHRRLHPAEVTATGTYLCIVGASGLQSAVSLSRWTADILGARAWWFVWVSLPIWILEVVFGLALLAAAFRQRDLRPGSGRMARWGLVAFLVAWMRPWFGYGIDDVVHNAVYFVAMGLAAMGVSSRIPVHRTSDWCANDVIRSWFEVPFYLLISFATQAAIASSFNWFVFVEIRGVGDGIIREAYTGFAAAAVVIAGLWISWSALVGFCLARRESIGRGVEPIA